MVIEHKDTAAGVGLGTFVQRRQALQADMSFHRYMSGSTSWNLFQRIALIAVCVTFPDNTHRVGDPFSQRMGGCFCIVWERHPIVDHAVDTAEPMKHKTHM